MTGSSTEKCVRTTLCTLCDAPDDDKDIDGHSVYGGSGGGGAL